MVSEAADSQRIFLWQDKVNTLISRMQYCVRRRFITVRKSRHDLHGYSKSLAIALTTCFPLYAAIHPSVHLSVPFSNSVPFAVAVCARRRFKRI